MKEKEQESTPDEAAKSLGLGKVSVMDQNFKTLDGINNDQVTVNLREIVYIKKEKATKETLDILKERFKDLDCDEYTCIYLTNGVKLRTFARVDQIISRCTFVPLDHIEHVPDAEVKLHAEVPAEGD